MIRPRFNKISSLESYGIVIPSQYYIDVTDKDPPYNPVLNTTGAALPSGTPMWYCSQGDSAFDCGTSGLWWEATDNQDPVCWTGDAKIGCLAIPGASCPSHTCSMLKTEYCPVLGSDPKFSSIGGSPVGAQSVSAVSHTPGDRTYRCFYDGGQLSSSCSASAEYTSRKRVNQKVLPNSNVWDSALMQQLCSNRSDPDQCPRVTKDANFTAKSDGKLKCSNLVGCSLCADWATSNYKLDSPDVSSDVISDGQMHDWCHNDPENAGDPSCGCLLRMDDPHYIKLVDRALPVESFPPNSWWKPCMDNHFTDYLVDSVDRKAPLPSNVTICAAIVSAEDNGSITTEDLTQVVECGGGGGGGLDLRWGFVGLGAVGLVGAVLVVQGLF